MTRDQLISLLRNAISSVAGPAGGETRLAAEKVVAELDKAGLEIVEKKKGK